MAKHADTNLKANIYSCCIESHMHYMLYLKRLGLGLNLIVTKRSGMMMMTCV